MRRTPCLLLLTGLALSHCVWADAITVKDDAGRRVALQKPAQRIVSLAPHTTELLFAAGAGERVVGVAGHSDYPARARELPVIGDAQRLNLEAIVVLHPDLVVAWKTGNAAAQVERLRAMGIPVFYSEPRRLDDVATNLQRLGALAGTGPRAAKEARLFREGYRRLAAQYADRTPVRTFYQIWKRPLITVGGKHLISQVITLCGGRNVFAALDALAPTVSGEAVLAANPQIIIAGDKSNERPDPLSNWRAWPQLAAVRQRQLYTIDPDLIQRQTPRILDGARIMCRQIDRARKALAAPEHPPRQAR